MSLVVNRSDLFPVGTEVDAFSPAANLHDGARPAGAAAASATVDAAGVLTFGGLGAGIYNLFAVVGGVNRNLRAGSQGFTAPGTLQERIAARRALVGA